MLSMGVLSACSNPFASTAAHPTDTASVTRDAAPPASSMAPLTPAATPSAPVVMPTNAPATPRRSNSPSDQQTGEPNPHPYVTPTRSTHAAKGTCASIWVAGRTLPKAYAGCVGGAKGVDEYSLTCNSGPDLWIRNEAGASEYYAFAGGKITHTRSSDGDAGAQSTCMS